MNIKALKYKAFWKAIGLYLGIGLLIGVIGIGYLFLGGFLISGIFSTTFTAVQFLKLNILAWACHGTYKFFTGVKIEK